MMTEAKEFQVFQFLHHLHDTVILLGAPPWIADLLNNPEAITADHIDRLRRYTCELIDATKGRLVALNTISVRTQQGTDDDQRRKSIPDHDPEQPR